MVQPPSFGPLIGGVVMIDVAEQEAGSCPVDDQPDVATDPNGPEVLILRPVDLVQLQARRTLARRLCRRVVRGCHAPRRVPHVLETRFGLSLADALEDRDGRGPLPDRLLRPPEERDPR